MTASSQTDNPTDRQVVAAKDHGPLTLKAVASRRQSLAPVLAPVVVAIVTVRSPSGPTTAAEMHATLYFAPQPRHCSSITILHTHTSASKPTYLDLRYHSCHTRISRLGRRLRHFHCPLHTLHQRLIHRYGRFVHLVLLYLWLTITWGTAGGRQGPCAVRIHSCTPGMQDPHAACDKA